MKKRVAGALGSNAIRNGLRSPHAKVSWHLFPAVVRPVTLQRAVPAPWNGLVGGMPPVLVIAQDLADQRVLVARGVVLRRRSRCARVVAAAVADADVEVAVLAEVEVAAVVVAVGDGMLVEQHDLGRRVEIVVAAQRERETRLTQRPQLLFLNV